MTKPWYINVEQLGNDILVKEIDHTGKRKSHKIKNYRPTLFIESKKDKTEHSSIYGVPLESIQPGTIKDTREFIERYSSMDTFKLYGNERFNYQYIADTYDGVIDWKIDNINIVTIDIETAVERGMPDVKNPLEEILLITLKHNNAIYTLGCKPANPSNAKYILCADERDLLNVFLALWKKIDPDVVIGWSSSYFDIPYIYNRMKLLFDEQTANKLSPWKFAREINVMSMGQQKISYKLYGISSLDYLDLYKKYTYTSRESYKLEYIASMELGETKTSYKEFDGMKDFYTNDWEKYVEYNINDVVLVDKLEKKLGLLQLHLMISYMAKANHEDAFSAVRSWDTLIYNWLRDRGIIIPLKMFSGGESSFAPFEGAYVKEPKPGLYNYVISFDVASMYPNAMRTWNMSPETYIEKQQLDFDKLLELKETIQTTKVADDYCVAANGVVFATKNKGFIAQLAGDMFDLRKQYKKKMIAAEKSGDEDTRVLFDKKQQAVKILANSLYGAVGCPYFRFYDVYIAEAVTKTGQFIIRYVAGKINEWMNKQLDSEGKDYVIASDTDSVFIHFSDLIKKVYPNEKGNSKIVEFLDKVCKQKLEKYIESCFDDLTKYLKCKDNYMSMGRDTISSKGIFLAKKRYILNMYDKEGVRYDKPKLKMMGIETQRSSTPEICRNILKDAISIIMNETENDLRKFVKDFKQKYDNLPPEQIAFPRGVNGMVKYADNENIWSKGTPIHVKGALIYNNFLRENGLTTKYTTIADRSKIKFLHLKEPNPLKATVIAFPNTLPKEMKLEAFVDRQHQFEKSFLDPLTKILDVVKYSLEPKASLKGLFS